MKKLYNPADENEKFEAKIWECLRRNGTFKADVCKLTKAEQPDEQLSALLAAADKNKNRFALIVLGLIGRDVVASKGKAKHKPYFPAEVNFETPWPQLPAPFPALLAMALARPNMEMPLSVEPWDTKTLSNPEVWNSHKIVLIPRSCRNASHRKSVIAELEKLVHRPSKIVEKFIPGSSVLGTPRDWGVFLLAEEGIKVGL